MIVYHEGLPGSGKTYEAVAYHILPAIQNERPVITNIEGINHEAISEMTHMPLEWVKANLICVFHHDFDVMKRQIVEASKKIKKALIVIDEVDKLWHAGRYKLPEDESRFITEHRHDKHTILLMGQDRTDCHSFWKNRIQRVVYMRKLDAVGMSNSYRWEVQELQRKGKWKKINSGKRTYKPKYFDLYQSHTVQVDDGETDVGDVYKDKRANVFINTKFLLYVPLFIFGIYFLVTSYLIPFFQGTGGMVNIADDQRFEIEQMPDAPPEVQPTLKTVVLTKPTQERNVFWVEENGQKIPRILPQGAVPNFPTVDPPSSTIEGSVRENNDVSKLNNNVPLTPTPKPHLDYFDRIADGNTVRLVGIISDPEDKQSFDATIEILEGVTFRLRERFNVAELMAMGWTVTQLDYGLEIKKEDVMYLARPVPIKPFMNAGSHHRN